MGRTRRGRLLVSIVASLTTVLTLITLAVPDWIEGITGADPDRGNGSLEWLVVLALAATSAGLWAVAWRWHRRWGRTGSPVRLSE